MAKETKMIKAKIEDAKQLLAEAESLIKECLTVKSSSLPPQYAGKRESVSLKSLERQIRKVPKAKNPASVTLKIVAGQIMQSTPERLARVEMYTAQIERGESTGDDNLISDELYIKHLEFASLLVKWGSLSPDDFEE
jgi:hypothetical protein